VSENKDENRVIFLLKIAEIFDIIVLVWGAETIIPKKAQTE
jgi:hypothetical protein